MNRVEIQSLPVFFHLRSISISRINVCLEREERPALLPAEIDVKSSARDAKLPLLGSGDLGLDESETQENPFDSLPTKHKLEKNHETSSILIRAHRAAQVSSGHHRHRICFGCDSGSP